MSTVYTERTEPTGLCQAKIWKILLIHLDAFAVEFRGFFVYVTVGGVEHAFSSDVSTVRDYAREHWAKQPTERRPHAKLDREKVAAIRARCGAGESQMAIAKDLGVSNRTVSDVICGRTWRGA